MKIVYLTHSLVSCWNHGNAHFLRGVLDELRSYGHEVVACEQALNWSLRNLVRDHGAAAVASFQVRYPGLEPHFYAGREELESLVDGADLVIVHEWNDAETIALMGSMRSGGAPFVLLFHDTHHRAVSEPEAARAIDLSGYDGVLAFGETLTEIYRDWGWGHHVWTWHEAADTRRFKPPDRPAERQGMVWIGNWGDGERSSELVEFLLAPAQEAQQTLTIHGVRYPEEALAALEAYGARFAGWAPNALVPEIFARHRVTAHVPRRHYAESLRGIPTIRVFEALACGIPLVSAPWDDCEGLFRPGMDFLIARNREEMRAQLVALDSDEDLRRELARNGQETIRSRHSCTHRARELLTIVEEISPRLKSRTVL